jgi:hypothetical protein
MFEVTLWDGHDEIVLGKRKWMGDAKTLAKENLGLGSADNCFIYDTLLGDKYYMAYSPMLGDHVFYQVVRDKLAWELS